MARSKPDLKSDEESRAANLGWVAHKRRMWAGRQFMGRPKHYKAWTRLTHDSWRTDIKRPCLKCGEMATPAEIKEFRLLMKSPKSDLSPEVASSITWNALAQRMTIEEREEAKRMYIEVNRGN